MLGEPPRPFFQLFPIQGTAGFDKSKGNMVIAPGNRPHLDASREGVVQQGQVPGPVFSWPGEVGDEQAARPEPVARRPVEAAIEKSRGDALVVEAVQQQNVGIAFRGGQILGRIGLDDRQAFVVGDAERLTQRDDIGIHLDDGQACARQMTVAELGQRTAPQPDHQHMIRVRHEQQKGHHLAGVGNIEGEGIVDAHGTLDEIQTEQQLPRLAVVDDERPGVAAGQDLLIERHRVALRRFEHAHLDRLARHLAGQLQQRGAAHEVKVC